MKYWYFGHQSLWCEKIRAILLDHLGKEGYVFEVGIGDEAGVIDEIDWVVTWAPKRRRNRMIEEDLLTNKEDRLIPQPPPPPPPPVDVTTQPPVEIPVPPVEVPAPPQSIQHRQQVTEREQSLDARQWIQTFIEGHPRWASSHQLHPLRGNGVAATAVSFNSRGGLQSVSTGMPSNPPSIDWSATQFMVLNKFEQDQRDSREIDLQLR